MKARWLMAACALSGAALAQDGAALFSSRPAGSSVAAPFRVITLPNVNPNQIELVADEGRTVLRITSAASASSVGIPLTAPAQSRTQLAWQWKVSRTIDSADMTQKAGDDFAARVYVFFDVPLDALPFVARTRIRLARLFFKAEVPTAALCYVWDNRQPVGTARFSAYTDRVRMIVMQSGAANAGKWISETRDVAADFRQAFGGEPAAITGVAVASDTDQTREAVTAWFGDVVLKP